MSKYFWNNLLSKHPVHVGYSFRWFRYFILLLRITSLPYFLSCRGKQLMVDFKEEPTRPVTHVMHFGKCKSNHSEVPWARLYSCALIRVIFLYRVGGVLRILGGYKFIDKKALHRFLLTCQSQVLLLTLVDLSSAGTRSITSIHPAVATALGLFLFNWFSSQQSVTKILPIQVIVSFVVPNSFEEWSSSMVITINC